MDQPDATGRLDKWLWAARFFKTRGLAQEAIQTGRVLVDGQRAKPGKNIKPGELLRIHKDHLDWEVEVLSIPASRRPASEARQCYSESEASQAAREQRQQELRLAHQSQPLMTPGRPTKRDRRLIHQFKQEHQ